MATCFSIAELEKEGITVKEDFQENTEYCDCVPLTEFDEAGNHKWKIKIVMHDVRCCKAEYSCREGFQTEDRNEALSRFCHIENSWNHTEPECSKLDTRGADLSHEVLIVAIPSALLVLFFIGIVLFVIWWRRKERHLKNGNSREVNFIHEILEAKKSETKHDQDNAKHHTDIAKVMDDSQHTTAFIKNERKQNDSDYVESSLGIQAGKAENCEDKPTSATSMSVQTDFIQRIHRDDALVINQRF